MLEPQIALTALACAAVGFFFWWIRERRLKEQRRGSRALYSLSGEIMSSGSPSDIMRQLLTTLPKVSQVSRVRLYLHNRKTKTLDRVPSSVDPEPVSLPPDSGDGVAICFRNGTLLAAPDTRRSPFYDTKQEPDPPRSVLFIPIFAEKEVLGVLELDHAEVVRQFSTDQRAAAQHLANQVGIALKLQEQQSVREQLFRSEKLAAAGQLVSGIVNELRDPLETMATRAAMLLSRDHNSLWERDLRAIATEARRASETVSRLVSLSRTEQSKAKPVDLNDLLSELMGFREREWRVRGVHLRNLLCADPLVVLGAEAQLEHVLLNLLVHAEQSLEQVRDKTISVSTRLMAQRALVEISYPVQTPADQDSDPFQNGGKGGKGAETGLAVCRGIIQSHGGEIRLVCDAGNGSRFEIELPVAPENTIEEVRTGRAKRKSARVLTVLLLEPEAAGRRHLITLLSGRGHRVVPVANGEEAADLAQRLRFDLALCSMYLPGSNWVEFHERIHHLLGGFVLLTEGYNSDVARAFHGSEGYVLHKPVDESEFEHLFATIESRPDQRPAISSDQ